MKSVASRFFRNHDGVGNRSSFISPVFTLKSVVQRALSVWIVTHENVISIRMTYFECVESLNFPYYHALPTRNT